MVDAVTARRDEVETIEEILEDASSASAADSGSSIPEPDAASPTENQVTTVVEGEEAETAAPAGESEEAETAAATVEPEEAEVAEPATEGAEVVEGVQEGVEEEAAAAEGEEQEAESTEEDERRANARWYVVHCYSGMEHKVKRNLETRIEVMGMQDKIFEVVVPTEEEIELRDGVRRRVERRVFPGYILVQMIMDETSWHVVRNTPGVTGFVGIGNKPTPLEPEEVDAIMKRIEAEEPKIKVDLRVGERVRITSGPFADFTGTIQEIYPDKGKIRVAVAFFNRETPVELDFLQVEKV